MYRFATCRNLLAGLLGTALFAGAATAPAYEVEAGSSGNVVYVLLLNDNPGAVFHSVSLADSAPSFVSAASASIVPGAIPGGGSGLAALEFDVIPGATAGSSAILVVTVSGLAVGNPLSFDIQVPLTVVTDAPDAQGLVGASVPAPDPGGLDSDGDGVTDSLELAFGSDPDSALSIPGGSGEDTVTVPVLAPAAALLLAAALAAFARSSARRRRPGAAR